MQYDVVSNLTLMRCFAVQINDTLRRRWRVCVAYFDLRWLNVWNGCRRVGAWRAARTFACIAMCVCVCLCLNLKCLLESANYWRSIQYEVVCSLIIMRYFAVQINDTLQWRWWVCVAWLTFVGWMYWMDVVVLARDEQSVRLFVLLSVCVCLCLNLRCVVFESAN